MITNLKKNVLKKIMVLIFIKVSILQFCIASLETKDELKSDEVLENQRAQGNLDLLQNNITQQYLLPDSIEITRMMGIARLFYYSCKKSMSDINHPIAKNLCILFNCFTQSPSDNNQVIKAVEELEKILFEENDKYYPIIIFTQLFFTRVIFYLGEFLSLGPKHLLLDKYMNVIFLKENFVLKNFLYGQKLTMRLDFVQNINSKISLHLNISDTNLYDSDLMYNNVYPKYLYFTVKRKDLYQIRSFDPTREYQFEYIDQHKIVLYKLVGFLTEERGNVYSYLYENNKWTRFINNKESCENVVIPCPLVVMYEKYAEYHKNT